MEDVEVEPSDDVAQGSLGLVSAAVSAAQNRHKFKIDAFKLHFRKNMKRIKRIVARPLLFCKKVAFGD